MSTCLLLSNLAATVFLTGLIWFVQIVHYPLFAAVGDSRFPSYERLHSELTTRVVAPVMIVEAITAVALLAVRPAMLGVPAAWSGLGFVILIWISTAFVQVPQHRVLAAGFSSSAHSKLVATNWIRTLAWSARSLLLLGSMAAEVGV